MQSRLVDNSRPLHDLYNALHSLCQSLQLEVLYSQTTKLIFERLGDYIRIEEYKPGKSWVWVLENYYKKRSWCQPYRDLKIRCLWFSSSFFRALHDSQLLARTSESRYHGRPQGSSLGTGLQVFHPDRHERNVEPVERFDPNLFPKIWVMLKTR